MRKVMNIRKISVRKVINIKKISVRIYITICYHSGCDFLEDNKFQQIYLL